MQDYARGRERDVARGADTPRLAALLLQKYGLCMVKAVAVAFDSARAADPIMAVLDAQTIRIDPEWREHDRARWSARPADLIIA